MDDLGREVLDERPTTRRRIEWMQAHDTEWTDAIAQGDRVGARELYEAFGELLREEMEEEGGNPVLSLPRTNSLLREWVAKLPGKRALDIGCGPTPISAMSLQEAGFDVTGIDVARSILRIARRTMSAGARFVQADGEQLPFADASFDVITCDDTLEHAFDQEAMVREAARVLRPGGTLILVTPNASGFHVHWARAYDLLRGKRFPRTRYHITRQHTRELRWAELRDLFDPWFTIRRAEPVGPTSREGVLRIIDRALRLPGMWRYGMVHLMEFERRPLGRSLVGDAATHYANVAGAESQTSPGVIRSSLRRWLASSAITGPVLDVGTGVGSNLEVIVGEHRAFGSDISVEAAHTASKIAPTVTADGARLPFKDASFGAAVCTEVLEHTDDPGEVFAEIARVLRPGGLAYITTPNYSNPAGLHKLLADRKTGRHDWNPWGAHEGGYEAFMTGRKLRAFATPHLELVSARGWDFGQAITGRFKLTDKLAWTRGGQAVLRRVLPRLEGRGGVLGWHAMHIELVLRRPERGAPLQ